MSLPTRLGNRRVVPRWRETRIAQETGEMLSLHTVGAEEKARAQRLTAQRLLRLQQDFAAKPSVGRAAELTNAAVLINRPEAAEDAAEFLLLHAEQTTPTALRSARSVLGFQAETALKVAQPHSTGLTTVQAEVTRLRPLLRDFPHNPLMHLDLARAYAALGQQLRAGRHLQIALGLAPQHRFILRTAVRFHVHSHDPRTAVTLLRRSARTPHDPWLVAAEISASMVAGLAPKFVRRARDMVERREFAPLHTSELAAALGTLELQDDGKTKRVRKMFRQALETPTENAVAQVQWAAPQVQVPLDEYQLAGVPRNFEMRAWEGYSTYEFRVAQDAFEQWVQDEPFSSTPAIMAAYLAGALHPTPARAIELTRLGLTADPTHSVLLNNMAFFLASDDQLAAAETYLTRAQAATSPGDTRVRAALLATRGLLMFRRDRPEEGTRLYEEAASLARTGGHPQRAMIARLYLVRERWRRAPEEVSEELARTLAEAATFRSSDVRLVAEHLRAQTGQSRSDSALLSPSLLR